MLVLLFLFNSVVWNMDGSKWMSDFLDHSLSLHEITLVGSHDSGTFNLRREYSPEADITLKKIMERSYFIENNVLKVAYKMCREDLLDKCFSLPYPKIWERLFEFSTDTWDFIDQCFDDSGNWIHGEWNHVGKWVKKLGNQKKKSIHEGILCVSDVLGDDFCDRLDISDKLPVFEIVADFIRALEMVQRETITLQLRNGVRFFEFQICFVEDQENDDLIVPHVCSQNLVGEEFEEILIEFASFISKTKEETIIINLHSFQFPLHVGREKENNLKKELMEIIHEIIGEYLVAPLTSKSEINNLFDLKYSDFLDRRTDRGHSCVLLFCDDIEEDEAEVSKQEKGKHQKSDRFLFVWNDEFSFGRGYLPSFDGDWEGQEGIGKDKKKTLMNLFYWTVTPLIPSGGFDFEGILKNAASSVWDGFLKDLEERRTFIQSINSIEDIFSISKLFSGLENEVVLLVEEIEKQLDLYLDEVNTVIRFAQGSHEINEQFEEFAEEQDMDSKSSIDVVLFDFITPRMLNWVNHQFNGIPNSQDEASFVAKKMKSSGMKNRKIVHISDLHIGRVKDIDEKTVKLFQFIADHYKKDKTKPLIMISGDSITEGTEEEMDIFLEYLEILDDFQVRIAVGNHDIAEKGALVSQEAHDMFIKKFSEPYMKHIINDNGLSVYILDSMIGRDNDILADGALGEKQRKEISQLLDEDSSSFRVLMLHHHPFIYDIVQSLVELDDAIEFQELLFKYSVEMVLTGHDHCQEIIKTYLDGVKGPYVISSGSSSEDNGCEGGLVTTVARIRESISNFIGRSEDEGFGQTVSFLEITLDEMFEKPLIKQLRLDYEADKVEEKIIVDFKGKELMSTTEIFS